MVSGLPSNVMLIVSEDDDDDFFLIQKSLTMSGFGGGNLLRFTDGDTLMQFLLHHKDDAGVIGAMIILLDLNMPRKDGRETLREIKNHPQLKRIPVIVLTTSAAEHDVEQSYDSGANAYAHKPAGFLEFQQLVKTLSEHWMRMVALPSVQ